MPETNINPPERERKRSKPRAKSSQWVSSLLFVQFLVCALLLIAAFGVKFFGGSIYTAVKGEYAAAFEDVTDVSEVLNVIAQKFTEQPAQQVSDNISDVQYDSSEQSSEQNPTSSVTESDGLSADADEQNPDTYILDFSSVSALSEVKMAQNAMGLPLVGGRVTSNFGYRVNPVSGEYKLHGGLDIGADMGDNVYAALDGTVVVSKSSSDYGNYIVVDHGNGLCTLYAHCSKLLKSVGDTARKGEVIALAGSTGVSTGPHLHFEVRINDVRIDPKQLLPQIRES